jgi:hypothetical protein
MGMGIVGARRLMDRFAIDSTAGGTRVSLEKYLPPRAPMATAERLDTKPVTFPSNHGGFLGGEYGQTGDPDAFAAKLRQVLSSPNA